MTSHFESLPADIFSILENMIPKPDLKQLRLTSRIFSAIFAPSILHTMTFDLKESTYQRELIMLQLLASGQVLPVTHTKALRIWSLTTRQKGRLLFDQSNHGPFRDLGEKDAIFSKWFLNGLSRLQNLESISWFPYPLYERQWAYDAMYKLLRGLPNLRDFEMSSFFLSEKTRQSPSLTIPFDSMSSLQAIKVTGIRTLKEENFQTLCRHIGQYRCLEKIYLEVRHPIRDESEYVLGMEPDNPDALTTLLAQYPMDAQPLCLKSVTLRNCSPLLSRSLLSHFKSLTRLRVEGIACGENTIFYLNKLTPGFLSYLESFSTLMGVRLARWFDGDAYASEKDRFFKSLLKHRGSLLEVDVAPTVDSEVPEGLWCASSPSNALVLGKLRNLQRARVGVKGLLPPQVETCRSGLHLVIDTFTSLPCMRVLRVDTEEARHSIPLYYDAEVRIRNAVRALVRQIAIPCHVRASAPFIIEHGYETYVPRMTENENGKTWMYVGDRLGEEHDDELEEYPQYFHPLDEQEDTAVGR